MAKSTVFNLSVRNLAYRLRKFKDILHEELPRIIAENEDVITGMIKDQLWAGINGNNEEIASYMPYAPYTIKRKQFYGQPYDRVTLKDTGAFYDSFYVEFLSDGWRVRAHSDLESLLMAKYKPTIFKLSQEGLNILIHSIIRPDLKNIILQK